MLVTRPPMTTVASGRWTSAPAEVASAIGRKPSDATNAVINTGRNRVSAARRAASRGGRPSSRRWTTLDRSTTPFSTAMPNNAMKPTPAEMEKG